MRFFILFITLVISFLSFSQGPTDGFMKGKNNLDLGLSYSLETCSKFYAGDELINIGRNIQAYSLFAIYGISNNLDIQIGIPFINLNNGEEANLQDGSLFLKYRFIHKSIEKGEFSMMTALGTFAPLSNYETQGGSSIGQQAIGFDGRLIGQYMNSHGYFLQSQLGYTLKSNPTPNSLGYAVRFGWASSKIYIDAWYELLYSFGGTDYRGIGDLAPTSTQGGFKSLGVSYDKVGCTFYYGVKPNFGLFATYAYTFLGRNTGRFQRYSFGFSFKPKL